MSDERGRSHRGTDAGPQHVSRAMEKILGRLGGAPSASVMELVFSRWEEIAGPECVQHVQPLRVGNATLTVSVDHPAWATKARMESGRMLRRLTDLGETSIDRIEVVVERP